jgi:hypothetical protein
MEICDDSTLYLHYELVEFDDISYFDKVYFPLSVHHIERQLISVTMCHLN